MSQNLGIYVCIGAFAATFAAGTLFVMSQRVPSAADVARVINEEKEKPKLEEKPKVEDKLKKDDKPKPPVIPNPVKLPRQPFNGTERDDAKAAVLRRWSIGAAAEKEEAHQPTYIRRIYVDPAGTRVV